MKLRTKALHRALTRNHAYSFVAVALVLWVALAVLKVVELLFYANLGESSWCGVLWRAVATSIYSSSLLLLPLGVVYLLWWIKSRKVAFWISTALSSLYVIVEAALMLYTHHNGFLLNSEIFLRPLNEATGAIVSAMGYAKPIICFVGIVLGCVGVGLLIGKMRPVRWLRMSTTALIIACILPIGCPGIFVGGKADMYIISKIRYLVFDTFQYSRQQAQWQRERRHGGVPYQEELIRQWMVDNPEYQPLDPHYPLQRRDNTPNSLGAYFPIDSTLRPNIVFIVVESLGQEFMDDGHAPFVDSLARTGLYWRNGLSTTSRSYGVVPAVTGSVGGPKGFQFGNLPHHQSLFTILAQNGYLSTVYYAGLFSYDNVDRYLTDQPVDRLVSFYDEYNVNATSEKGNLWGYHDQIFMQRVFEEMQSQQSQQPSVSLIITISMHEDLDVSNDTLEAYYENQAITHASKKGLKHPELASMTGRCAAVRYTDDALRKFFAHYATLPSYQNTIFVLTGDHASGLVVENPLSFYHVPIIVWSPMLTRSARFGSLVSHNDITPSLCRLMADNFGIKMPPTVHWLGTGFDTSATARMNKNMLLVDYSKLMREMVCGQYYYNVDNQWVPEAVWQIDTNLNMSVVDNPALLHHCQQQHQAYRYLYHYTHDANHLKRR